MKQIIFFVLLASFLQNELVVATIPTAVWPNPKFFLRRTDFLDCSQYSHDYEILSSFPFVTYLNPLTPSSSKTYGLMNADEKIYYLNIANQRFVPKTIFCLNSLQELYVRGTSFYEFGPDDNSVPGIPSEIERLAPSLRYLGVFDTKLNHLPEQIGSLSRLSQLQLYNTELVALPDSIGNLSSLSYLYLQNNKLTTLPSTMANLRLLRNVTVSGNPKLRSIQSLNGPRFLYSLSATSCLIERLPLNLPYLYYLSMSNNNLTDLIGIGTLGNNTSSSKNFYFDMNRIRFISPQIRNVPYLYRLNLDNNELATLPTEIFNITTLRYLYIRNNLFSGNELRAIVAKFNATNPSLTLSWSSIRSLPKNIE